jgi:HK97 family phage portal protein
MSGAAFPVQTSTLLGDNSTADAMCQSFAEIYKSNGIVFSCMAVRQRVFSQVSFRFAALNNGRVSRLFGTPDLAILEKPWPNGTTSELAARMIQDVDTAGNFYAVREGGRLYRRDPNKTSIILSGKPDEDEFVDVLGYVYRPKGKQGPSYTYTPDQMCHWTPVPDPDHPYRGMSWISPILREIKSDNAATDHKSRFFSNSATPNMVVTFPEGVMNQDQFDKFKAKMDSEYAGARNGGKTMYLAPGADVTVVGKDFKELDFSETQGRDEARIAAAAGVPAVIAGVKESLAGSSLNQGNYSAARRQFGDGTMADLYAGAAGALQTLVPAPQDKGPSKLWHDMSQIPFFREDRKDNAEIQFVRAQAMRQLTDAGWTPDSVNAAFEAEDMTLLVHSGLFSVQLQPAGTKIPATGATP